MNRLVCFPLIEICAKFLLMVVVLDCAMLLLTKLSVVLAWTWDQATDLSLCSSVDVSKEQVEAFRAEPGTGQNGLLLAQKL